MAKKPNRLTIETLKHDKATRKNIPTAEYQSVMKRMNKTPSMSLMNVVYQVLRKKNGGARRLYNGF